MTGAGTRALPGLGLVRRRLPWVLLAAVVGFGAGAGTELFRESTYESTTFLTVSSTTVTDPGSIARSTQALARLATSTTVVGEPLRAAGLDEEAVDPRLHVSVKAAPDAPIISVTGTSDDPAQAQRIATVVIEALTGIEDFRAYDVSAVGPAPLPTDPTVPAWLLPMGGAGLAGVLGLVGAATLPERDRRWARPAVEPDR